MLGSSYSNANKDAKKEQVKVESYVFDQKVLPQGQYMQSLLLGDLIGETKITYEDAKDKEEDEEVVPPNSIKDVLVKSTDQAIANNQKALEQRSASINVLKNAEKSKKQDLDSSALLKEKDQVKDFFSCLEKSQASLKDLIAQPKKRELILYDISIFNSLNDYELDGDKSSLLCNSHLPFLTPLRMDFTEQSMWIALIKNYQENFKQFLTVVEVMALAYHPGSPVLQNKVYQTYYKYFVSKGLLEGLDAVLHFEDFVKDILGSAKTDNDFAKLRKEFLLSINILQD